MGAFLDAAKKYGKGGAPSLYFFSKVQIDEPSKPTKPKKGDLKEGFGGFDGFDGSFSGAFKNILSKDVLDTEKPEKGGFEGFDGFDGSPPPLIKKNQAAPENSPVAHEGSQADTENNQVAHEDQITPPRFQLTHITTRELIFNDPATGKSQHIPAGTPCRQFADPKSAEREGALSGYEENWGATRNLQSGYSLIWIAGMVRGVGRHDFELRTDQ